MASDRRVAVVTGGGRGIGRGIVGELAALGLSVVVNFRGDAASADEACREAEARGAPEAVAVQADVANLAQGRRLLDAVIGRFGRI
ncbi:MAG TPA: SDR family NAD(P)-dependent oxidoreductase, partial [Isosphaeraceae bacterium]|nr:SDR family NAD(P)-dependent oxidoreductase [Isosphaeraceae bacterium]